MSPDEITLLLRRLEDLHDDVREVKAQAKETNGRVKALELWKARLDGARTALSWVPALMTGLGAAVASAVITSHLT